MSYATSNIGGNGPRNEATITGFLTGLTTMALIAYVCIVLVVVAFHVLNALAIVYFGLAYAALATLSVFTDRVRYFRDDYWRSYCFRDDGLEDSYLLVKTPGLAVGRLWDFVLIPAVRWLCLGILHLTDPAS